MNSDGNETIIATSGNLPKMQLISAIDVDGTSSNFVDRGLLVSCKLVSIDHGKHDVIIRQH